VAAKMVSDVIQKDPENGDDEATHLLRVLSKSSKCIATLDKLNVLLDAWWLYELCTVLNKNCFDENGNIQYDKLSHGYAFEPPGCYMFDACLKDFVSLSYNIANGDNFVVCQPFWAVATMISQII
jgi:hypothetical protein